MNSTPRRGFTLIELLVVITIIVVLLALLTPALDKAIYMAELARCSAGLDMLGGTLVLYAMDHKRSYPRTQLPRDGGYQPDLLGWRNSDPNRQRDLRPVLRGWIDPKLLTCPLNGGIGLDIDENDDDTQVFANYDLWFGWRYDNQPGMYRLGDRFGAYDSTTDRTYQFPVLISDKNLEHIAGSSQASHPDRSGRNRQDVYQDQAPAPSVVVFDLEVGGTKVTQSRWRSGPGAAGRRGLLDLNFGLNDGSVLRYDALEIFDDRLKPAPAHANDGNPPWDIKLPQ
jgi:prepilin-type N-terminal cleavage/methylation domain-containing protein